MKKPIALFAVCVLLGLAACAQGGGDLIFTPVTPDKTPPKSKRLVRVAHFVDSARPDAAEVLASTSRYTLAGTQTYYFDYVVISGAEIKQGEYYAYVTFSEPLLQILRDRKNTIKPLRDKGIKVLLGISGGGDGVSFGSLMSSDKEQEGSEQELFALQCADACKFYGLSGIEFYDIGGASGGRTPYPAVGASFWDGEQTINITTDEVGQTTCADAWKKGAEKYTNMLSYLIEFLGAASSFQGDIDPDAVQNTPILIREAGYGRYLPPAVPRYAFATTLGCVTYGVNADPAVFGKVDGETETGKSYNSFIQEKDYAPAMIDLSVISDDMLAEYSKRLGRRNYFGNAAAYNPAVDDGNSPYGLVYYTNLQPPSDAQTAKLSVTSVEVFGVEVSY
jgi:hypothetical protein